VCSIVRVVGLAWMYRFNRVAIGQTEWHFGLHVFTVVLVSRVNTVCFLMCGWLRCGVQCVNRSG